MKRVIDVKSLVIGILATALFFTIIGVFTTISNAAQLLDLSMKFKNDSKIIQAGPSKRVVGTLNGVAYFYGENACAVFSATPDNNWRNLKGPGNWWIRCGKDAMEDFAYCDMTREDLAVSLYDDGRVFVIIGVNNYPGSKIAIRIDKGKPISGEAGFVGNEARKIIEKLKAGKTVTTRYQEWPYRVNIDKTMNLYGLREALEFLYWVVPRIK